MTGLPELTSSYPLAESQVSEFRSSGHTMVRGLISKEELTPYRDAIMQSTTEFAKQLAPIDQREVYGQAFIQHMNLWTRSEVFARFTLARRFAEVAAKLMGVSGVRLYHDQALYKEPGGGYTPWHQDQQYWPLNDAKCVTLWMPLVDATPEMGTLRFASGSQELGYLGPLNISADSETRLEDLIRERGFEVTDPQPMAAGDATFHDGWVIHGAPGNSSKDRMREAMTIIYFEDGSFITEPDSDSRRNDLASWFPGQVPGEKAGSKLNPVVYSG